MESVSAPPAVSIVIPAFNAEATVPSLVNDCLAQTFEDIEVICVDDGSDDGTRACIEELSRRHATVRALSIEHGGPTAARSAGAEAALGAWVIFADADDRVEPTWIESLVVGGRQVDPQGQADIVAGANCWSERAMVQEGFDLDLEPVWAESRGLFPRGARMDVVWRRMLGDEESFASLSHSMCDKLFRTELARDVFRGMDRSVRIGEDTNFNIVAFARAHAVALTYATGYRWADTKDSLSDTPPPCALQDNRVVYAHVKRELLAHGYEEPATTLWRSWMGSLVVNQLWRLCEDWEAAQRLAHRFMASYEETAAELGEKGE